MIKLLKNTLAVILLIVIIAVIGYSFSLAGRSADAERQFEERFDK